MATSPVVRGTSFIKGTSALAGGGLASRILENAKKRYNGEKIELKDNNGQTVTVIYKNETITIQFTVYVETTSGFALPTPGTAVTLDSLACYYEPGAEQEWTQDGVSKINASATYYPNLGT